VVSTIALLEQMNEWRGETVEMAADSETNCDVISFHHHQPPISLTAADQLTPVSTITPASCGGVLLSPLFVCLFVNGITRKVMGGFS